MSLRETNAFLLKKATVLEEHVSNESELRRRFAARGFELPPGFMHEQLVLLELATKHKLDQANFEVMQETVQRRLEEIGLQADKEALVIRLAFEIRKSGLFAALNREFADLKLARAHEREAIDLIGVELMLRENVLIYAEADLNAEIEALKVKQIEAEALSLDKEVELAEGRLALAQEKLKLIDPIKAVIAEQKKTLLYEQTEIVPLTEQMLAEKQTLIDLQETELIPAMILLAAAIKRWAAARPAVVDAIIAKAQAVTGLASREEALTTYLVAASRAKLEYATSLEELLPFRTEVATAEVNKALNLILQAEADLLLARAERDLAEEQQQKIGPLQDKAEALGRYADKQSSVATALAEDVAYRKRAAAAKILAASYRIAAMHSEIDYLLADVEADQAKMGIDIVRSELSYIEKEGDALRLEKEVEGLSEVAVAKSEAVVFKEGKMGAVIASKEARVYTELNERLRWRRGAAMKKIEAEREYHTRYGYDRYYEQTEVAKINAMKTVTSQLLHAIA